MADFRPARVQPGAYAPIYQPPLVAMVGDSITAHGYTAPSGVNGPIFGSQSILMQTVLQSAGKLRYSAQVGGSGYTTTQVLATLVPQVIALSPKPTFCLVLCGTNDGLPFTFTDGSLNATQSNLLAIWTQLKAAGIIPVACASTPRNAFVGASAATIQLLNMWIARKAQALGIPFLDLYAVMADTTGGGGYQSGYAQVDGIHPSDFGAYTLGSYIAQQLTAGLPNPPAPPAIPSASTWPSMLAYSTNALFLAGAAGLPTGWVADSGTPATAMIPMTATEGVGNWFAITPSAAGIQQSVGPSTHSTYTAGHQMRVTFKVKASGVHAGASGVRVRISNTNEDANLCDLGGGTLWLTDIPAGAVFDMEFPVPSGLSTYNDHVVIAAGLATATATATVSVGQFALVDLDAQGINE